MSWQRTHFLIARLAISSQLPLIPSHRYTPCYLPPMSLEPQLINQQPLSHEPATSLFTDAENRTRFGCSTMRATRVKLYIKAMLVIKNKYIASWNSSSDCMSGSMSIIAQKYSYALKLNLEMAPTLANNCLAITCTCTRHYLAVHVFPIDKTGTRQLNITTVTNLDHNCARMFARHHLSAWL